LAAQTLADLGLRHVKALGDNGLMKRAASGYTSPPRVRRVRIAWLWGPARAFAWTLPTGLDPRSPHAEGCYLALMPMSDLFSVMPRST
jgi:hypothetical protein